MASLLKTLSFFPDAKPVPAYTSLRPAEAAVKLLREAVVLETVGFLSTTGDTSPLITTCRVELKLVADELVNKTANLSERTVRTVAVAREILNGAPLGRWPVATLAELLYVSDTPRDRISQFWLPLLHFQRYLWEREQNIEPTVVRLDVARLMIPGLCPDTQLGGYNLYWFEQHGELVQGWCTDLGVDTPAAELLSAPLAGGTPFGFLARFIWTDKIQLTDLVGTAAAYSLLRLPATYLVYLRDLIWQKAKGECGQRHLLTRSLGLSDYAMSEHHVHQALSMLVLLRERDDVIVDDEVLFRLMVDPMLEKANPQLRQFFARLANGDTSGVTTEELTAFQQSEFAVFTEFAASASSAGPSAQPEKPAVGDDGEDEDDSPSGRKDQEEGALSPEKGSGGADDDQAAGTTDPDDDPDDSASDTDTAEDADLGDTDGTQGDEDSADSDADTEGDTELGSDETTDDVDDEAAHTQSVVIEIDGFKVTSPEPPTYSANAARRSLTKQIDVTLRTTTSLDSEIRDALRRIRNRWLNLLSLDSIRGLLDEILAGKPEHALFTNLP